MNLNEFGEQHIKYANNTHKLRSEIPLLTPYDDQVVEEHKPRFSEKQYLCLVL
jgi:hypothetical protein